MLWYRLGENKPVLTVYRSGLKTYVQRKSISNFETEPKSIKPVEKTSSPANASINKADESDECSSALQSHFPLVKMAPSLVEIFKCIFMREKYRIPIQISLKFVPRSLIDNNPALVQVMAWRPSADKSLHEPMLTELTDAYMRH